MHENLHYNDLGGIGLHMKQCAFVLQTLKTFLSKLNT